MWSDEMSTNTALYKLVELLEPTELALGTRIPATDYTIEFLYDLDYQGWLIGFRGLTELYYLEYPSGKACHVASFEHRIPDSPLMKIAQAWEDWKVANDF